MILQELCEYYDILSNDPESKIAKQGYSSEKVHYAIVLKDNGEIESIMDLRTDEKKPMPKMLVLPKIKDKTSDLKTSAFPFWDNAQYVFGYSKREVKENGIKVKKLVINNDAFQAFKDYNLKILESLNNSDANSLRNFLNTWNPDNADAILSNISNYDEKMLENCNFIFMNKSFKPIQENVDIKNAWENFTQQNAGTTGQCLISGKNSTIARLHPKIKGVRAAQSAGANIVSFNADAFASYGKEQSFNAPVSETIAFKYGTMLNYMLQSNKQKTFLADATIVFWAQHQSAQYAEIFNAFLSPSAKLDENKTENEKTQDHATERLIHDVLTAIRTGAKLPIKDEDIDSNVNFCILALTPNNARISIRFFLKDNFGDLIKKLGQHYDDMEIIGSRLNYIPLWLLLKATVPERSKENASSPLLAGKILSAILTGNVYPTSLLSTMIERVCATQEVDYIKAAVIKACLKRKYRITKNRLMEDITMSVNEELKEPAYLLGRLFAVLEQAQWNALGGVNSGIKERFFASAASSPRRVFPQLVINAQNHLAKMDNSIWLDKMISEILYNIRDNFPARLSLDEQGLFILGYYHQRQTFFTKKEEN